MEAEVLCRARSRNWREQAQQNEAVTKGMRTNMALPNTTSGDAQSMARDQLREGAGTAFAPVKRGDSCHPSVETT